MKTLLLLSFLVTNYFSGLVDNRFIIPSNNIFFEHTQIESKEVAFEVDPKTNQSTVLVSENGSISIDCEELILNGDITFKNSGSGENTSGIRVEIFYKKLSGNGRIVNGISDYKGNVTFILKFKK